MKIAFLRQLPKDKLNKVLLVSIVALCAIVGVMQFYVLRNWRALMEAKRGVVKLNAQIQQAEAHQSAQDPAYPAQVKSFVEAQRAAMISGDPFAWVVREISLLAEQHPVRVESLRPRGKTEFSSGTKCPTYTVHLEITAGYDEIGAFIRDLENKFPAGEVRALSVAGNANDKGRHQAALDVMLLINPEPVLKKAQLKKMS
jgi:hypothetical protein